MKPKPPAWYAPVLAHGTTSPEGDLGVINLATGAGWSSRNLAAVESHCVGAVNGGDKDAAQYGAKALELIEALRSRIEAGDAVAASSAAFRLGQLLHDWNVKDFAEADFKRGVKNLQAARAAAKARGTAALDDSRAAEWSERVEKRRAGTSMEQEYRSIAREVVATSDAVKKAVQRYRRRSRR